MFIYYFYYYEKLFCSSWSSGLPYCKTKKGNNEILNGIPNCMRHRQPKRSIHAKNINLHTYMLTDHKNKMVSDLTLLCL